MQQLLDAGLALICHLQAHAHTLTGKDFYVQLAQIAFVPATIGGVPGSSKAVPLVSGDCAEVLTYWTVNMQQLLNLL